MTNHYRRAQNNTMTADGITRIYYIVFILGCAVTLAALALGLWRAFNERRDRRRWK